jgi:cytosine/creatinine deaminase
MTNVDICIRNARLRRGANDLADIAVAGGRIVGLGHALAVTGRDEIDAGGNLVTESFVNPHLHLCKVWTLPMMAKEALKSYRGDGMINTLSALDLASKIKESYDAEWITQNARCAVALAALYGTTHIRAFADVDRKARLEGVKALLAVREEFRSIVDVQVVAFAQDGIVREPGADRLMLDAMDSGPTWLAAFHGLNLAPRTRRRISGSASISPCNSARMFPCCSMMSAIPTCARSK